MDSDIVTDPTGLGRWSGMTIRGKNKTKLTIITAYRVCKGSKASAPIGSSLLREVEYFQESGITSPDPRQLFFDQLQAQIHALQDQNHRVVLMFDANERLAPDSEFYDFLRNCDLHDLQDSDPAQSTYILHDNSRLDYMFGCTAVKNAVKRQGTLAYREGPQADHRGLFADLDTRMLLGDYNNQPILPASARLLRSGNPKNVKQYNEEMHKYYSEHDMVDRIRTLYRTHSKLSDNYVRKLLNKWDADQGRSMKFSEAQLRSPPKQYDWSNKLRNAGLQRRYWRLRLRSWKLGISYDYTYDRLEQQTQVDDPSFKFLHRGRLSLAEIKYHLAEATKTLTKCQKDATGLRIASLEELLEQYETDTDEATKEESRRCAQVVRRTIKGEASRRLFRKIGNAVKSNFSGAIKKILVPRHKDEMLPPENIQDLIATTEPTDLVWEHIVDAKEMETYLLRYNKNSFRAAATSPNGHGVIHDAMTFSSLSPAGKALLAGEFPPEWHGSNTLLQEFLASFAKPTNVTERNAIKTEITPEDFSKGIRNWKESTSTSPSGRHLGHYKALIQDEILLECQVKMMNIAIARGISLDRWGNAVNVMIEKDIGRPAINRLRIIHLFEADFNLFLKLQWGSRLVRNAVKLDLLNANQHGSIPDRTAMDPVMLTQLTTDLSRILKCNLARFDNDASACYDRIIVMLGMLAARRCGMPENAVRTHAAALLMMKYVVKTIHGISEENYQGTVFEPLFGTGQGSGASPSVWLTLVVIMMNTIDRVIPERMSFTSPDGSILHKRLAEAFVDDTALGFTDYGKLTYVAMVKRLQEIAQTWERLLFYSGGALNLKKCFWYILYWQWHDGRPECRVTKSDDPPLTLKSGPNPIPQPITCRSTTDANRTLGVFLAPNGNFSKHLHVLKTKADRFSVRLRSSRLNHHDVRTFHSSMYKPSMRYSLPALAVDEEELEQLQTKIMPTMLQKLGASSTTPTVIRHGPTEFAGLYLFDLRTEFGIETIQLLRDAVYSQSEVGNLILLNLQYSQLEAGIGPILLEHPSVHLSYLTPTWVTSVRQYMDNHNVTMTFTQALQLLLRRKNDKYIMQTSNLARYSVQAQTDINLVRIYLQVTTLADLSTNDGKESHPRFLRGEREPTIQSTINWPRQGTPTHSQKLLWKTYITETFISTNRHWKQSLGEWTAEPTMTNDDDKDEERKTPDPVTQPTIPKHDLQTIIDDLPHYQRRLLIQWKQTATDLTVWKALRSRKRLEIISDGGLKLGDGTFGWKIILPDRTTLFQGAGPVDGPRETESSTRSELSGLAAPLLLLTCVSRWWGIPHRCKLRWLVDSTAAIKQVKTARRYKRICRRQPDNVDVISLIKDLSKELGRPMKIDWVKGHQDDNKPYDELPRDAQLNIDVDKLATEYRDSKQSQTKPLLEHCPLTQVSIRINGILYPGNISDILRYHVNGSALRTYLGEARQWSQETMMKIDWHPFALHFKKLKSPQQVQHMKFIYDLQPLGHRRHKIAPVKTPILKLCPCCKKDDETPIHFLTCKSQRPARFKLLRQLRRTMCLSNPHPSMDLLYSGITQWLQNPDEPPDIQVAKVPRHLQDLLQQALREQDEIGWHNALKGHLSKKWTVAAQIHHVRPNIRHVNQGVHNTAATVKALHIFTQGVWKARNDVLHNQEDRTNRQIRSTVETEIKHLHSNPQLLLTTDQHFCERDLNKLLYSGASVRRRWLYLVKKARRRYLTEPVRQQSLQKYFARKFGPRRIFPQREPDIDIPTNRIQTALQVVRTPGITREVRERPDPEPTPTTLQTDLLQFFKNLSSDNG